jgi:hypothetical protein
MGQGRGAYWVLVEKPERTRRLGKPRSRCEDNVKMGLQEAGWRGGGGEDWLDLAQDTEKCRAFVNAVTNLRVP